MGYLLGTLTWYLKRRKQQIALGEIDKTFPGLYTQQEKTKIVKQSFQESHAVFLETFCFPRINPENCNNWMRISGESHLREALSKGRGLILVLVHYGANQMIMAALGHRGYRINQIGSRPDDWHRLSGIESTPLDQRVFSIRNNLEQTLPANFIYIDKSMRPVFSCLKRNEIMLLACDGRAGKRFLKTRVGNRIMNLSSGPFRIAEATKAPLIPVFPLRNNDGVHDLYIEKPIEIYSGSSSGAFAQEAAEIYGQRLTEWIRHRPDHYTMLMTEAAIRSKIDKVPLFEDYRCEK